jgi:fluoride exporter
MTAYLYIAAGGALGSIGRYWMASTIDGRFNTAFPHGTVAVNILGCFIIGMLAGMQGLSANIRLFLMVGLCGGFTTFSAFSLQTLTFMRDGLLLRAGSNVLLSVMLCLLATWAGLALIQRSA